MFCADIQARRSINVDPSRIAIHCLNCAHTNDDTSRWPMCAFVCLSAGLSACPCLRPRLTVVRPSACPFYHIKQQTGRAPKRGLFAEWPSAQPCQRKSGDSWRAQNWPTWTMSHNRAVRRTRARNATLMRRRCMPYNLENILAISCAFADNGRTRS